MIYNSGHEKNHPSKALHLLHVLLRMIELGFDTPLSPDLNSCAENIDMNRIIQLETLIESHFMENLREEDFASILHLSTRQLERIVYNRYHCTLRQMIIEKRVQIAAQLLKDTDLNAEQIGIAVGYQSKSSFYKAFTQKYGMTPIAYRKENS